MAVKDVDFQAEIQKIDAKINREQERKKKLLERQRIREEKHKLALGNIVVAILGEETAEEDLKAILEEWKGTTENSGEEKTCVGEYDKPEYHCNVSGS